VDQARANAEANAEKGLQGVAPALAKGHPLELLALASSLLTVVDARSKQPFERPSGTRGPDALSKQDLVKSLLGLDGREASALLAAVSVLSRDEAVRDLVGQRLASRADRLPDWVTGLGAAEVYRAVEMAHVLGDSETLVLGVRWPGGHELCVALEVDHNLGSVLKDGFAVDMSAETVVGSMKSHVAGNPDITFRDIDLADARSRATEAIDLGAVTVPRFESTTWPDCRPLVEWLLGLLPDGGKGYRRPEWGEDRLAELSSQFFASRFAEGLDGPDFASLLDTVLGFAVNYGPGDPLRWSPSSVEIFVEDLVPRKVVADVEHLSKLPALLRGLVRFCHDRRGVRPELTAGTLARIGELEPEYQRTVRSPRPQGAEALLAAWDALAGQGARGS
jgi:hypothetical protein